MSMFSSRTFYVAAGGCVLLSAIATLGTAKEWKSGIKWQQPPIVDPGEGSPCESSKPPSDAIVIFDGTNLDAFENGDKSKIEDGALIIGGGGIRTKQAFGDMQLHLEFATPSDVKGNGQGRGNSGVYLMGKYEVQILDSFENETYYDGQAAAIYKQSPPLVNASRGPGQWQSYDIIFDAPHFNEDGSVAKPARVTVLHNGVLVQHAYELIGGTGFEKAPSYSKHAEKLPFNIQYHGNPVRFRNIWVREFKQLEKTLPGEEEAPVAEDAPQKDEPKSEE